MITAFNDVQPVYRFHLFSDTLQQMQRAEPVTGTLYKQDRLAECAKHLPSQLRRITSTAQRVT